MTMANQKVQSSKGGGKNQQPQFTDDLDSSPQVDSNSDDISEIMEELKKVKVGSNNDLGFDEDASDVWLETDTMPENSATNEDTSSITKKEVVAKKIEKTGNSVDMDTYNELVPDSIFMRNHEAIKSSAESVKKFGLLAPVVKNWFLNELKKLHSNRSQAGVEKYFSLALEKVNEARLIKKRLFHDRNTLKKERSKINQFSVVEKVSEGVAWNLRSGITFGMFVILILIVAIIEVVTISMSLITNSGLVGNEILIVLWACLFPIISIGPKFLYDFLKTDRKKSIFIRFFLFLSMVSFFTLLIMLGILNPSSFREVNEFSFDFPSTHTGRSDIWARIQQISQLLAEFCFMTFAVLKANEIWSRHWKIEKKLEENPDYNLLSEEINKIEEKITQVVSQKNTLKTAKKIFRLKKKEHLSLVAIEFEKELNSSLEEKEFESETIN